MSNKSNEAYHDAEAVSKISTDFKFDKYQEMIEKFIVCPQSGELGIAYAGLGLAGESGEVCELIKKSIRDKVLDRDKLMLELGDVLWYLSFICRVYGFSLSNVAALNIVKLQDRFDRKKLFGSGDLR